MSPIRILGSVLTLLNGALAVYLQHFSTTVPCSSGTSCAIPYLSVSAPYVYPIWLAVVGGILVADSLVSFVGVRVSFALGAVLSGVVLVIVALQLASYSGAGAESAIVLSAICVVLDVVASRPSRALSEKDSPLNLPVFG